MDKKRICEIVKNKEIKDIYYHDEPIWVQEIHGNIAKVGFMNSSDTKDLYIDDLYERNLNSLPYDKL